MVEQSGPVVWSSSLVQQSGPAVWSSSLVQYSSPVITDTQRLHVSTILQNPAIAVQPFFFNFTFYYGSHDITNH